MVINRETQKDIYEELNKEIPPLPASLQVRKASRD